MGKFKETKFGKFLDKVGDTIGDNAGSIAGIALKAGTGNIGGALSDTLNLLKGSDSPEAKALLDEFTLKMAEFELEQFKLEVADRDSARNREIEIAKTGKVDFMMIVTGSVGLLSFLSVLFSILFRDLPKENEKLVYHLLGMVEGITLMIFAYYYGTSKGSKDKQDLLNKK